jgi:transcriptional regulator with XRE-family HTH domain
MPSTKTKPKEALGRELRQLRIAAGLEPAQVAERMRKSLATVSKHENGHVRPDFLVLSFLLDLYGVTDEQREHITGLWEEADDNLLPLQTSPDMGPKYKAFLRQEAMAATERTLGQTVIPGLLQTRAYAEAVHQPARSLAVKITSLEKSVESRIMRQRRLVDKQNPLVLHALIDEAALRRLMGGTEVMVDQLRHLLEVSKFPNVTIQVIPEAVGVYAFMGSAITILDFADPKDRSSIYVQHEGGGQWIEDPDEVEMRSAVFQKIAETQALSAVETRALIRARLKELGEPDEVAQE